MKKLAGSALSKQKGAVLTMEASVLLMIGMVMAISYGIVASKAYTFWFSRSVTQLETISNSLLANDLNQTCNAISSVNGNSNSLNFCNNQIFNANAFANNLI